MNAVRSKFLTPLPALMFCLLTAGVQSARAAESLWVEAELLEGIRGFCWPMGDDTRKMRETAGHWALSGPGWAAEWNQGGESGFLSIATGANDDKAVASKTIEVPEAGKYFVWVRYGDWREKTERFDISLDQAGRANWTGHFGEHPVIEEDNEMKLYWGWSFGWDRREVELAKGPVKLSLISKTKDPEPRQIDVIVLTTDPGYRPRIKDRPDNPTWDILEAWRQGVPEDLESLARRKPDFALPPSWKIKTFNDKGFVYLWNVASTGDTGDWLSDDPKRVLYPWGMRDKESIEGFKKKYGGQKDVPIFADSRVAPAFHGVGPVIFKTDPTSGEVGEDGRRFAAWLDANPQRNWGTMMNYHPGNPVGPKGQELFAKYRNRYVGAIAGESLGYCDVPADKMKAATEKLTKRRELAAAFGPLVQEASAEKYRKIYGRDLDQNSFLDVISCLSVGNITFLPLLSDWGCRTLGYESAAISASLLNMRWAFMRGAARQGGHLTATYRSSNFGDSATMFSNSQTYSQPQNILDNYYSVYSGSGVTWYKFDIWYQYMAGSSIFYHEQGFDEFWRPGGTTAAGQREIQLSPKGNLVDRFLRVTAAEPDRGAPFTPVAFLVDYAHGWEPSAYWPNAFKNFHNDQTKLLWGDHEKMLQEYFWTAFYPIGPESEKPMMAVNETYVPGVFGDMFDVILAYPQVERWTTIDTYPVVIANGEIELTAAEGQRLAKYVENGGTLLVADAHLTGPGLAELKLPSVGAESEANEYVWFTGKEASPTPRFRFKPIDATGGRALANTPDGKVFCASFDRGQGRLIYLSVPHGMSISRQAVPVVARLMAHLTRGLMPIEVDGDVQWLVNKTDSGWAVTMLNFAGQEKPQQGILPTDFRQSKAVTIKSRVPITSARDRLLPTDPLTVKENRVNLEVSAGGVRVIELK